MFSYFTQFGPFPSSLYDIPPSEYSESFNLWILYLKKIEAVFCIINNSYCTFLEQANFLYFRTFISPPARLQFHILQKSEIRSYK